MNSRWSDREAAEFISHYGERWGEDLALRAYASRLLGSDPDLVLHGGGNTSVKTSFINLLGEATPAVYVKASGADMATIEPVGHTGLDLAGLRKLGKLRALADGAMANQLRIHQLFAASATASIETLAHAFIPPKFVDHTHADAILALTNQNEGRELVREALGESVLVLDYVKPGFLLAKATADAFDAQPGKQGMVWMHHGLLTWGETARASYEATIELVNRAEEFLAKHVRSAVSTAVKIIAVSQIAAERLARTAPIVRGLLARRTGDPDRPYRRVILQPLVDSAVIDLLGSPEGRGLAMTPALTTDHLIRTKALPLLVDDPSFDDPAALRGELTRAIERYSKDYEAYLDRNWSRAAPGVSRLDPLPRVVLLPGLGALCSGDDVEAARIARDITAHTLRAKSRISASGSYQGLSEEHLFDMEYYPPQHEKLPRPDQALPGHVALVTGAAGAIGSGICRELAERGCHVAVTDLPGEGLDSLTAELRADFADRVVGVPLDVTDPVSVARAFEEVARTWGGVDLVVINAGVALVRSLAEMELEAFRSQQRVNTEGALLLLGEAARHFGQQATGGDIVLISTKNVFAPGARFGAYSATKAAAHQLGRIASIELAEMDVRVNMVAPDAVFSEGPRRSGLWAAVGPDRMRARGLGEAGLEDYYRNRNLLKARITARHVGRAVVFFATRQTPTTGATLPVDGGLPDATPR